MKKSIMVSIGSIFVTLLVLSFFSSSLKKIEAKELLPQKEVQEEERKGEVKQITVLSGYLTKSGLLYLNDSKDYKKSKVTLMLDTNEEKFQGLKVSKFLQKRVVATVEEEESASGKIQHRVLEYKIVP